MRTTDTKKPGQLKIISLGDVHLGHHQTPTDHIIHNLTYYCTNDERLKDVDLLIITGDLFDRLLSSSDESTWKIQRWMTILLLRCAYHNVKLRVVEGTPSHDRKQSQFFIEQKNNAQIEVDLHYAKSLELEYIDIWDMWILYIPDEWKPHTSEIWIDVQKALNEKGLTQVDLVIMHGAFEYQLPHFVPHPKHDSVSYQALCRHYIFIGHIHFSSQNKNILAAGSFDRIAHGEEGPKGFYEVVIRENGSDRITFIENKGARVYKTIDVRGDEIKTVYQKIEKMIKDVPKGSALRLRYRAQDPASGDLNEIKKRYPDYDWSTVVEKKDKDQSVDSLSLFSDVRLTEFTPLTENNIVEKTQAYIEKRTQDQDQMKRCVRILKECLHATEERETT